MVEREELTERMKVRKELTDLLDQLGIDSFGLNTEDQVLTIHYKEDFDDFYPRLGAEPMVHEQRYGSPYHHGKIAFFDYKGWEVQGRITRYKTT